MLILGCGYVGRAVLEKFPGARFTRRNAFQLQERGTWNPELLAVGSGTPVLWTFPAATCSDEAQAAVELYETFFQNAKVIIYGTTSAYLVKEEGEEVTEESPLDSAQIRTQTEEELRARGACIVHLAGIFGPDRDPLSWYLRGLIRTGSSYLNLIHLNDIVRVTEKLFESERISGERFNLSNGYFKTHQEISGQLKVMGLLPANFSLPTLAKPGNKRVNSDKIKKFLALDSCSFLDFP